MNHGIALLSHVSTYLGSLFEQSDDSRGVSAADRPVQRTHPAAIHVLHRRTVIHQMLHLTH